MTTLEDPVRIGDHLVADAGSPTKTELTDDLDLVGRVLRTLTTRIGELEAEVMRVHAAAEQARAVTASEVARRVAAERELRQLQARVTSCEELQASSDELQRALDEVYATKLLRWSAMPRRLYAGARGLSHRR